jgi:hypothetical protein
LYAHGRALCWGDGGFGVHGDNGGVVSGVERFLTFSDTVPITQLSGSTHICALHVNARVRCWGHDDNGQLGNPSMGSKGTGIGTSSITAAVYVTFAPSINTIPIVAVDVSE